MITKNGKAFEVTLKAIKEEDIKNNLIKKGFGSVTLISEEKTFYMTIAKSNNVEKELEKNAMSFFSSLSMDVNVDLDSFEKAINCDCAIRIVAEAAMFANHKEVSFKKDQKEPKNINLLFDGKWSEMVNESEIKLEFVNFARDLQDLPPNEGTSEVLAKQIEDKAKTIDGLKVTVYNKKQIEDMKMGLLLSVNAGSHVEPRVVVLEYVGDPSKEKTALVGKGITFDSGGYNLKPGNFMEGMKFDMSGAAIMLSTVMALAKAKAKANVTAIGMFTDNRIGGHATLTESVIKSMNGQTVEINNTDAEGRLVLADGITYAVRNVKADKIIDAATLTGAIVVALGPWHTGVFTKHDDMWDKLAVASTTANERVWRQPMIPEHLKAMQVSKIADLTNSEPGRNAGSSTAAAFLDSFAEETPYMHLDIAGTADDGKRGKAVMLRSLFEMLKK